MSPVALVLALSLHGLAAAALWWAAPLQPTEPPQDTIMIAVDAGAPPSSTEQQGDANPVQPANAGMPDPAPAEEPREKPQQTLAEPQPPQPEQPPQPTPPPSLEQALASPEELPPPTARDFPKPVPPPPPPRPATRPPQGASSQTPPPRPARPTPPQPSMNSPASVPTAPSNSSDWLIGASSARNEYLSRVFRHLEPFRRYPDMARVNRQQGRVVTRVVINRAGELLAISIERSSGWPLIDNAEIAAIRSAMPLPPPPATMPGDSIALNLPYTYQLR